MKKYDIIYSVTAHESIECVNDLYENIMKFHPDLSVALMVHCEEPLYQQRYSIPFRENLILNPIRSKKERFTSSIFFAHLDNYNLAVRSGIDFNFFCTLSSNNLFVRDMDMEILELEIPSLKPQPTGYSLGDTDMWMWEVFVKNEALVDIFKKEEIEVNICPHPGAYYRKEVIKFMYDFCQEKGIEKSIFTNDVFGAEEVMFPSLEKYATGRVSKRFAVCLYNMNQKDIDDVIADGTCRNFNGNHFTIVRVKRYVNDELRKYVRKIKQEILTQLN